MADQAPDSSPTPAEPVVAPPHQGAGLAAEASRSRRAEHRSPWGGKAWQTSLRAEIARIQAALLEVDDSADRRGPALSAPGGPQPSTRPARVRDQIEDTLAFATSMLDAHERRRWISRVGRSGGTY